MLERRNFVDDDQPTPNQLRLLLLELVREAFRPYAENYAAEYSAAMRSYRQVANSPANQKPLKPPEFDPSHLEPIRCWLRADAIRQMEEVLRVNVTALYNSTDSVQR